MSFEIFQIEPGNSICAHLRADHNKSPRLQMMINGCEGRGHCDKPTLIQSHLNNFSLQLSTLLYTSLLLLIFRLRGESLILSTFNLLCPLLSFFVISSLLLRCYKERCLQVLQGCHVFIDKLIVASIFISLSIQWI